MAIAFGAISTASSGNDWTSVTVSGSTTMGIVFVIGETTGDNITAVTWGGVSMTKIAAAQVPTDHWNSAWAVNDPASGATIHFTGGGTFIGFTFYYTGSGLPKDSSNTNTSSTANSIAVSTTVVASNCWTVMCALDNSGIRTYTTDVGIMRVATDSTGSAIADSNGTVSTGSQSMTLTQTGGTSNHSAILISIAPRQRITLALAQGSYSFTGHTATLTLGHILTAVRGLFTLTSFAPTLTYFQRWKNTSKHTTVETNRNKSSASSWTNSTKHSTTETNRPKS